MGLTGRYDFKGIQKAGRAAIDAILTGTTWGVWLLKSPFKGAVDAIEDAAINWLTNRGLIWINVGAVLIDGKVDEDKLNSALDSAFDKLKIGRDKITPEQGAKIDAETDVAFDKFADVPTPGSKLPNKPNPPL